MVLLFMVYKNSRLLDTEFMIQILLAKNSAWQKTHTPLADDRKWSYVMPKIKTR